MEKYTVMIMMFDILLKIAIALNTFHLDTKQAQQAISQLTVRSNF